LRRKIEILRLAELSDPAVVHDQHAVGHGQRLALVVGHVDEGDPQLLLERDQRVLHLLAKPEIERAERFVEQQDLRTGHDRARQCDTLALTTREFMRQPCGKSLHGDELERLAGQPCPVRTRHALHPQGILHILRDRHVRKQRIALEDSPHVPAVRRDMRDILAGHHHPPEVGCFEAGDCAQDGGLSRTARPENGEELSRRDVEGHMVECGFRRAAIGLFDMFE
jgi:hypothetical protein